MASNKPSWLSKMCSTGKEGEAMWRLIQKKPAVVSSSNHSKARIAAIKEQKGSGLQTREHVASMNFAIGSRLWQHVEPAPELGANIEETCQASGQEAIVA